MSESRALLEAAAVLEHTGFPVGGVVLRHVHCAVCDLFTDSLRRADRPEARVAVEEPCSATMLCPYPQEHPIHAEEGDHDYLPAPRPPEPDRTAALVEALATMTGAARDVLYVYGDDLRSESLDRLATATDAAHAALAPTPDEAP